MSERFPPPPSGDDRLGAGDLADLEARVRAAGRYMRASDDLRPRTLEAARVQRGVSTGAWTAAVAAAAAMLLVWGASHRAEQHRRLAPENIATADAWQLSLTVRRQAVTAVGGPAWAMVDLFGALRHRQAELLGQPRDGDR